MKRAWGREMGGNENAHATDQPLVYICYHPDDKKVYSVILKEIERITESTLFKRSTGELGIRLAEDNDISKAGILIMVVSENSLNKQDDILLPALKIASERNIPVLPILVGDCSAEKVNNVLGSRHCFTLNKEQKIEQDLSNRLEEYLSLYLWNNELISRIRHTAFRKRIFVSYRRKDKECVRAFLKRMQEDERFADVALWRDACLMPGEVFSEELSRSISESDVFLLCVTPNTFEKDNYILVNELPLAVKREIPIIPVDLSASDQRRIYDSEEKLDTIYSEFDALNRIEAIIPSSESMFDYSPEKNYLLGKAYWMGIDTEINYRLAVFFNSQAVEAGYEDAVRLEAIMEKYGHGAWRDVENAWTWSQCKIDLLRDRAQRTQKEVDVLRLCDALSVNAEINMTSPFSDKDPGTTRVTSKSEAIHDIREVIKWCELVCDHSQNKHLIIDRLIKAYSRLSRLLYDGFSFIQKPDGRTYDYEQSSVYIIEALGYALNLEEIFSYAENNSGDQTIRMLLCGLCGERLRDFGTYRMDLYDVKLVLDRMGRDFFLEVNREGFVEINRMRGDNYELICCLLEKLKGQYPEERRWTIRLCEFAWDNLLNNPTGIDNLFWGNKLQTACQRMANMLEYEGRYEAAEKMYNMFFSGEMSGYIDGTHKWHCELRNDLRANGFRWLRELYTKERNYEKLAALLTVKRDFF